VGNPEISDLQLPARADQQIARLDIAVYHARRVRCLQGSGGLSDQSHGPRRIYRPFGQQAGQRRPVNQFHHQVGRMQRIGLAVVIDLRYPRMRQRARMPGLGAEPGQALLVVGVSRTQQFHRYRPVQHEVGATPDVAHPAHAHPVVQSVPAAK
jgi:hypothetical protein